MGNNIAKLRKQKGWTQEDFGQMLGVTKSAVSLYESGRRSINSDVLSKMAEIFGVSVDKVLGNVDDPDEDVGVRPIVIQPELVAEDEVLIPVVASLRCGYYYSGDPAYFANKKAVPVSWVRRWGKDIVYVEAIGDSMFPVIRPRDLCVCVPGDAWQDGWIVVVNINDSDTIKRIRKARDGGIDLIPENEAYDTMHLSPEDIDRYQTHVLGHVVKVVGPDL